MNIGKIVGVVLLSAVVLGLIALAIKLISGFFGLLGGLINLVLGVAVVLALVLIVAWMFRYAAKNGKK